METGEKGADRGILMVSFGTSYNHSRDMTIKAVEDAVAEAFPDYQVRRAFTSQTIIRILRERDGLHIHNVTQALDRAAADGIRNLVVQPTHLMDGLEYHQVVREVERHRAWFDQILTGKPLLAEEKDMEAVARAVAADTKEYDDGQTAVVLMGHGTEAESNRIYGKMQRIFDRAGFDHYYIGTVEAKPDLEYVAEALRRKGIYKKVVLSPLMLVAGDHASNDMAGDGEDSWKTVLGREGYQVECRLRGLGELEAVRKLYVEHVRCAFLSKPVGVSA